MNSKSLKLVSIDFLLTRLRCCDGIFGFGEALSFSQKTKEAAFSDGPFCTLNTTSFRESDRGSKRVGLQDFHWDPIHQLVRPPRCLACQ